MSALVEPLAAHRFDEARLAAWLGMGALRIRQFQGGQSNPTFLVETAERRLVLRKKPPGVLLPSAHQIEREWRIISALYGSPVPVPRPVLLCEDPEVIGTPFYVMEHVEGRILDQPDAAIFPAMAETLAALHAVDWRSAGLEGFGKPDAYLARQVERWGKQYRASVGVAPDPAMEALILWLPAHLPPESPAAIAHGDYRLGNLIVAAEAPRVVAVLDWELSTIGDPLADLAYCCLPWHLPQAARGWQGLDVPPEADFLDRYCGRRAIPHWTFYLAFALFRLSAILHGIHARALTGNASSANALEVAGRAALLSGIAWELVR